MRFLILGSWKSSSKMFKLSREHNLISSENSAPSTSIDNRERSRSRERSVSSVSANKYICLECSTSFNKKSNLKRHVKHIHLQSNESSESFTTSTNDSSEQYHEYDDDASIIIQVSNPPFIFEKVKIVSHHSSFRSASTQIGRGDPTRSKITVTPITRNLADDESDESDVSEEENTNEIEENRYLSDQPTNQIERNENEVDADDDNLVGINDRVEPIVPIENEREQDNQDIIPVNDDEEWDELIRRYWNAMKTKRRRGRVVETLNVNLWNGNIPQAELPTPNHSERIWNEMLTTWNGLQTRAKLNCSVGCILEHKTSGELRYFHASSNNATIFKKAKLITTRQELQNFFEELTRQDLAAIAIRERPNTAWKLNVITNISFYFYKLIGMGQIGMASDLPTHILNNRHVITMHNIPRSCTPYTDNLCFFRCLALKVMCKCSNRCSCTRQRPKQQLVKVLFQKYSNHISSSSSNKVLMNNFPGIELGDLISLEKCFDLRITVFSLNADETSTVIWTSSQKEGKELFLDLQNSHFSFIKDVNAYTKGFSCPSCEVSFTKRGNFNRHKCSQEVVTNFIFEGGKFKATPTIFEQLKREIGISVAEEDTYYPFLITYDIECYLPKSDLPPNSNSVTFTSRHELMSISVCSNVPGFKDPKCFVSEGDTDSCISSFVQYISQIADEARDILEKKLYYIRQMMKAKAEKQGKVEERFKSCKFSNPRVYHSREEFCHLFNRFDKFISCIPILGFNSQNYDLNVMKGPLLRCLQDTEDEDFDFVVKRTNKMSCIQSRRFKFLDISNFIAPGFSYAKYLKAFKCSQQKGFYPYEYMDDLEKLKQPFLPAKECFYSSLRDEHISDADYEICLNIWKQEKMKTLKDFLVWYNNLDVVPFVEAVEKQKEVYRTMGIDMLKDAISLPGLAVKWMLKLSDSPPHPMSSHHQTISSHHFKACQPVCLIKESDKDIYFTIKDNIVGGPSIVFHRLHESKKTLIRERKFGKESKLCELILGVDANALYLWSMMQEMPTGNPRIRRFENGFAYTHSRKNSMAAHGWLQFLTWKDNIQILHENNDKEFRIGQHNLPVDGYCEESNTVFQFHGCFWHGHNCNKTKGISIHPYKNRPMSEVLEETIKKEEYVKELGYRLVRIWECEWNKMIEDNTEIKNFISIFNEEFYPSNSFATEDEIIQQIIKGEIYGFIECDISVPENLYEKFSEMSPIFKNTSLNRNHLSESMKEFAEKEGMLPQEQRTLVGSMFGQKILLLTTLAKWYLNHGLIITKIYQVIEYTPRRVFQSFGESVSNARRAGDKDPDQELIATTNKLIGNSSYGKTITEKLKHRNVKYIQGDYEASLRIRSHRFESLEEIDDSFYELTQHKPSVSSIYLLSY